MRMYDLILKKRNGEVLSKDEIDYIVERYTQGEIPDYQMSAFLMAVYFQGMDERETTDLTLAMAKSGDLLDLSEIHGVKVDKHSTGGIGDKTTLIIGPMLASLEIPVAKMSGRGLGFTGGTIDKLESIPGFRTALSREEFIRNVNELHIAIAGQTANLAPADKKIYALRDVTGTVEQASLIASSIMSKKLASGADVIVLDVKTGSGAFMKTEEAAEDLARRMVSIGKLSGRKVTAVLTDMNEPLGQMVGNSLEVQEAIQVLRGEGDVRLNEVVYTLAAYMILGAGAADSYEQAKTKLIDVIRSGKALHQFAAFVERQGGDPDYILGKKSFAKARYIEPVFPERDGYLADCKAEEIGHAVLILGGGRETKESVIDHNVGIQICNHLGDTVHAGTPFAYIHGNSPDQVEEAKQCIRQAYTISEEKPSPKPVVKKIIE